MSVPDCRDPAEKKTSATLCEHLQDQQGEHSYAWGVGCFKLSTVIKEKQKQIVYNTKAFPPTVYPVLVGMGELVHIYKEKNFALTIIIKMFKIFLNEEFDI